MVIIIACVHTKLEFRIFEIFIEHFSVVSPLHWGTNFWYFRRLLNNNYYHKNIFKKIKYLFETRKEGNIYVCVNLREVWGYKCKKRSASTAPGRRCCPWARTAVDDHVSRARDRTAEILHSVTNWAPGERGPGAVQKRAHRDLRCGPNGDVANVGTPSNGHILNFVLVFSLILTMFRV